ncbi:MAG TPA: exosome complex protein Rrp42 [Thermoplasmata archaeon]|jgi:exosome complex component RRP42|nr:exosome complex protein Rrp42 [Thermoplasmata archaeon]
MSEEVTAEILTTHILDLAAEGKRLDGRGPDEYRPVSVEPGFVVTADGSALARIGETAVLAGIKLEPGKPFPDTPNAGVLTTNAELIPLSSPIFEPGPPQPGAIEVSRVVDRAIRAAETVDLTRLVVTPGEKTWVCYVDMHVLDHGGNLIDTACLAAVTALAHATVPAKRFEVGESDYPLDVQHLPIECTFVRLGDAIVVDPTFEEEQAGQGRLTVATDETGRVVAMQKGLVGAFSPDDVKDVVRRALAHGDRLRAIARGGPG